MVSINHALKNNMHTGYNQVSQLLLFYVTHSLKVVSMMRHIDDDRWGRIFKNLKKIGIQSRKTGLN